MLSELTSTSGLVALGALAASLIALLLAVILFARTRRLRAAQTAVLGDERRDLVDHAESLQSAFVDLREFVEHTMNRLDGRVSEVERRLDGCLAYHSVLRYDAYGEMSGRQSSSLVLLDSNRSGVVITSIIHREHARIYVKPVGRGEAESELSPEEAEAIEVALSAEAA